MTHGDRLRVLRELAVASRAALDVGGDGHCSMHAYLPGASPDDLEPWVDAALATGATLTVAPAASEPGTTWVYLSLAAPAVETAATEAA